MKYLQIAISSNQYYHLLFLLFFTLIGCRETEQETILQIKRQDLLSTAKQQPGFFKSFNNDLTYIELSYYKTKVNNKYDIESGKVFTYMSQYGNHSNNLLIYRFNHYFADTSIYVFEYPYDFSTEWHSYIRICKMNRNAYKGFVIIWINRPLETIISYWNRHRALYDTYNWNIDEFTDTVYSTLPKHIIEREYPEFRGVYKYLDLKSININGKISNTHPDSLLSLIELEYNKGK